MMHKEIYYVTKNKKILTTFLVFLMVLLFIFVLLNTSYECFIHKYFNINCPACGLTRSFRSLLKLNFMESIKYNVLGIPLFITFIVSACWLLKDAFSNQNTYFLFLFKMLEKYYKFIFITIVITVIINNYNLL